MRRSTTVLARLGLALGTAGALLLATAAAAQAGEAGRTCQTFYAQGDPASGWGYTVCVKLVHDTSTHEWWATGSVSSTTPGIRLHLYDLFMNYGTGFRLDLDPASVSGTGTAFVAGRTVKFRCVTGILDMTGYASGYAIWPNGVTSYANAVHTTPFDIDGTC